jgi:hypothetical protein
VSCYGGPTSDAARGIVRTERLTGDPGRAVARTSLTMTRPATVRWEPKYDYQQPDSPWSTNSKRIFRYMPHRRRDTSHFLCETV